MGEIKIEGGKKLSGSVDIQGAKNSVLPILASTIIGKGQSVIHNCPNLSDVSNTMKIMKHLGCKVGRDGGDMTIWPDSIDKNEIPDSLMRELRSSIIFLGAILTKMGKARISAPGGCELGARPIDLHLDALRHLGVHIEEEHGYLNCYCPDGLKGTEISLAFPSVGASENIMLAAVCAKGNTVITNVAREPEIEDLQNCLNKMGAKISGAGSSQIYIEGVDTLTGAEHSVIPDRIAAATFLIAGAITGGDVTVQKIIPDHQKSILSLLRDMGCEIYETSDSVRIKTEGRLDSLRSVRTMPYPGFPTDAQALLMALTTTANGSSVFIENIFEARYKHAAELMRMGASIKTEGRVAIVEGVKRLMGARVEATDLRGGAALILGGLAADGETNVYNVKYIDRGYEKIEDTLKALGGIVYRV